MPTVKAEGCCLFLDTQRISLGSEIQKVISWEDCVTVLLKPSRKMENDNILGLDLNGVVLWRIERLKTPHGSSFYTDIGKNGASVCAFNFDGNCVFLEPRTGRLVRSEMWW
jgi:hypothetical protein